MPIILDDLTKNTTKLYTPKDFSNILTGDGKTGGVINNELNLRYIQKHQSKPLSVSYKYGKKQTVKYGNQISKIVPFYLIAPQFYAHTNFAKKPDFSNFTKIYNDKNYEMHLWVKPHLISVTNIENGTASTRKSEMLYQILYAIVNKNTVDPDKYALMDFRNLPWVLPDDNILIYDFTSDPASILETINTLLIKDLKNNVDVNKLNKELKEYIDKYSLYDNITALSKIWSEDIHNIFKWFTDSIKYYPTPTHEIEDIIETIKYIQTYNVPLESYKEIYHTLEDNFKSAPDVLNHISKQNLNLLLTNTLSELEKQKNNLEQIPKPKYDNINPKFSKEQKDAIKSLSPLTMVQSGAGTGKSTTLLGRIDFMIDSGIKPEDIMVLSFTNAAANNILEKNPKLNSMTIASMIHTIYSHNFPKQELSNIDTVINSLNIYFPYNKIASTLRSHLITISRQMSNEAFTLINNFVEKNVNEIIDILNTIKQTTLELEILIAYQLSDKLEEPDEIKCKHLILDEVQDNSIFEFIYILKNTEKFKRSLYIIGDSSQTLYEFRNSNPRALNVLEDSKVFDAYKLQTNYRSNQEILDFANVLLTDIEANNYANIQLKANSLKLVNVNSFKEKVKLEYLKLERKGVLQTEIVAAFKKHLIPYINEALINKKQIAILAFTRKEIAILEKLINDQYPDINYANLIPQKSYNQTIFSKFIEKYENEIKFMPNKTLTTSIAHTILNRLDILAPYNLPKNEPFIRKFIKKWADEQGTYIEAEATKFKLGGQTKDEMLQAIKKNMIEFEIKENSMKAKLLADKNELLKEKNMIKNANIVFSTIHSAKGLEFDQTIVLYDYDKGKGSDQKVKYQEVKRLYYVAFTRAKEKEFILAYGTPVNASIILDYENTILKLKNKDKK